ncbi:MAG: Flp pilus assembly complex ATPase component TadA [Burkholderiales bacterium]|jgi:general secretion pathway protein E|nr:Flp pilus assembly complex ATPase component TadA [Burkholderiales bacterium]
MNTTTHSTQPFAEKERSIGRHLQLNDILKLLIADGIISADAAKRLTKVKAHRFGEPLERIAMQQWKSLKEPYEELTVEALVKWLAGKLGVPYFHIDPLKIDMYAVTQTMSNAYAERYRILPVAVTDTKVVVATGEPFVRDWMDELSRFLKRDIEIVFANPADIRRYIGEFYSLARSMKQAQHKNAGATITSNFEQLVELGNTGHLDANDRHIVTIVDWLWQYAFEQRASDIHIEPRRDVGIVRFRIDGILHAVYNLPIPVLLAATSRIKLLARMEIVEKRRPQDGRVKTSSNGKEIDLRVSTMPTAFGEKIVMRIFTPEVLVRSFSDLGFSEDDRDFWDRFITAANGIILVTGPTGSGKTTTLYSTLRLLAKPEVNVCTIEDPIEMIEPLINQMQVHHAIGVDFAAGVRTLLRQDPDIIMVGEIRDKATADMAVQAALTGHLVLSTLHTNDAPSALTRLLDLGVPGYLINSTLLGVMAQRLVRTLCPKCKTLDGVVDEAAWTALTRSFNIKRPEKVYRAVGCLDCRMTGYLGRIGLYEIMEMTAGLRELTYKHSDDASLRSQAYKEGMRALRISGALKIIEGTTTAEEVLKNVPV